MPYHEPDPQDPNVLVGVSLPGGSNTLRAMAEAFADEFAALGFDEERLLRLFRHPGYQAAHRAYRALGEYEIRRLVRESVGMWGRIKITVEEALPQPELTLVGLGRPGRGAEDRPGDGESGKERSDA